MNELDLVRDLGETLGPKCVEPTAEATRRVEAYTRQAGRPGPLPGPFGGPTPGRAHRRRTLRVVVSLGAAAAVAAGAVALLPTGTPGRGPAGIPANANLTARSILLAAAQESSMTSFSPPDPSSFVYTELVQTNRGAIAGNTTELWLSVDGSKDSAAGQTVDMAKMIEDLKANNVPEVDSLPDSMSGKQFFQSTIRRCASIGHPKSGECAPPGYVADAPTDAAGMRDYLFPVRDGRRVSKREAWARAFNLLPPRLLSPASKTALFETLAGIPGLEVQHNVTMTALPGRRGVAVVAPTLMDGLSTSLVFDADSHDYIGCRIVTTRAFPAGYGQPAIPAGAEIASQTVLRTAVVADAGLRPDGTRPQAVPSSQTMGNAKDVISYEMFTPWTGELASAFAGEATPGAG